MWTALRDPEHVERVWDEAVDGAWAVGKAPLMLLSELLQHVQDENLEQAELTASESEYRRWLCVVHRWEGYNGIYMASSSDG